MCCWACSGWHLLIGHPCGEEVEGFGGFGVAISGVDDQSLVGFVGCAEDLDVEVEVAGGVVADVFAHGGVVADSVVVPPVLDVGVAGS